MRQNRNNFLRVHSRLRDGLDELPYDRYDFVLIDCPPNFNVVTKTAIACSDYLLIPAIPDYLSTLGIDQLRRHVSQLVQDFNDYARQTNEDWGHLEPTILGVVPTMIKVYRGEPISTQRQYISQLVRSGLTVFDTFIRKNDTKYGDAPQYGVPVVLTAATGQTYIAIREELEELTTEFLNRIRDAG
jgi:chromosome partitioning protein